VCVQDLAFDEDDTRHVQAVQMVKQLRKVAGSAAVGRLFVKTGKYSPPPLHLAQSAAWAVGS
jgi:hypothetical protein